jgi:Iron-regulated ABC transporter membrane component SufB
MGMRQDLYNLIEDGITPEEVLSKNTPVRRSVEIKGEVTKDVVEELSKIKREPGLDDEIKTKES